MKNLSRHKSSCRDTRNKRKQNFVAISRNSIVTRYLMSQQEIKEKYMKNTTTDQFMLCHNEK